MRTFILLAILVLIASCDRDETNNNPYNFTKTIDATYFTLETPEDWELYLPDFIEHGFYGFLTNQTDSIFFDMGYYAYDGLHTIIADETMGRYEEVIVNNAQAKLVKKYYFDKPSLRLYLESNEFGLNLLSTYNYNDEELIESIFKTHRFKNP